MAAHLRSNGGNVVRYPKKAMHFAIMGSGFQSI